MKYDVLLTVRGEQYYDGADPDQTELTTQGVLERTQEGWLLSYEESELTGMPGTTTTFAVCGGRVRLRRTGGVNSEMIFEMGKTHTSLYEVPFGTLTVDVVTDELTAALSERGGEISIGYGIAVEHQLTGKNRFAVKVKTINRG